MQLDVSEVSNRSDVTRTSLSCCPTFSRMSALRLCRNLPRYTTSTASASRCRHFATTQRLRQAQEQQRSPHAQFYSDLVPGMIPIALLGSAVYMVRNLFIPLSRTLLRTIRGQLHSMQALQLLQSRLSHEKHLDEARSRINELEAEIDALLEQQQARTSGVLGTATPVSADPASGAPKPRGWFGQFW